MPLTFISRSSDFVNILRRVWKIYVESRNKVHFSAAVVAVKMKPCIVIVLELDSGSGDPGSILGRVGVFVSLSKRHLLPKSTGNTQE